MALAYDRTGRGPVLVLLHPLGADRRVWNPLVPLLRGEREVITVDLPGFGQSGPLRDGEPHPRALAAAVAEQLSALGVDRPHVAGNSLGGWVALELGLTGLARSVTAIAPAGLWAQPLVPKAAIAHRAARSLVPLIGPLAATRAGRSLLLRGSVAHPPRLGAGANQQRHARRQRTHSHVGRARAAGPAPHPDQRRPVRGHPAAGPPRVRARG